MVGHTLGTEKSMVIIGYVKAIPVLGRRLKRYRSRLEFEYPLLGGL